MYIIISKNSPFPRSQCSLVHLFYRTHLCKYDINLTYPQNELLPSVAVVESSERDVLWEMQQKATSKGLLKTLLAKNQQFSARDELSTRSREEAHTAWKRDLSGRANGTIDPWVCTFKPNKLLSF